MNEETPVTLDKILKELTFWKECEPGVTFTGEEVEFLTAQLAEEKRQVEHYRETIKRLCADQQLQIDMRDATISRLESEVKELREEMLAAFELMDGDDYGTAVAKLKELRSKLLLSRTKASKEGE